MIARCLHSIRLRLVGPVQSCAHMHHADRQPPVGNSTLSRDGHHRLLAIVPSALRPAPNRSGERAHACPMRCPSLVMRTCAGFAPRARFDDQPTRPRSPSPSSLCGRVASHARRALGQPIIPRSRVGCRHVRRSGREADRTITHRLTTMPLHRRNSSESALDRGAPHTTNDLVSPAKRRFLAWPLHREGNRVRQWPGQPHRGLDHGGHALQRKLSPRPLASLPRERAYREPGALSCQQRQAGARPDSRQCPHGHAHEAIRRAATSGGTLCVARASTPCAAITRSYCGVWVESSEGNTQTSARAANRNLHALPIPLPPALG